ncbi:regulator [Rhodococcus wratislaviensis]|uniref:Regulator n=1 Tax=Rhodococcus wratislaviensis TaxID=44752 RepID=A0A402CKQ6_RHOWR|nr:PaaX family transcriptional regulator C-terminal domain-containing protein [Rhodococcus wratislaviensis]GCE44236.1 regulator [Rhodococcus wratislaviensis]
MEEVNDVDASGRSGGAPDSRQILVTFLGSIVRRMGNWMPISGTVELMGQLGVDGSGVRTAVFRLKKRGWVESESRGGVRGYVLTEAASHALAAGDELIWHARQPAELSDGWCVVNFSVPESKRALRHQLRTRLTALGFGNLGSAVWIAPARMHRAAREAIDEVGLTQQSAVFVGEYAGGPELTALVRELWDLDEIDRGYRTFTATHEAAYDRFERTRMLNGLDAFVTYLSVVNHWRKLPFRDPGLPLELLPKDWAGPAAGELFEHIVQILEGRALAHAAASWPDAVVAS